MTFVEVFFAVFIAEICKELAAPFIVRWVRPTVKKQLDERLEKIEQQLDAQRKQQ